MTHPGPEVEVWWARTGEGRDEFVEDLDEVERARLAAYVRAADQERFLLGVTMVRRLLGARFSLLPASVRLDRTCPDCGKPHGKVRADGVELSVTHSGELVGVAIADVPVGIDVERVDETLDVDAVARVALAADEVEKLKQYDGIEKARAFTAYWTRREAAVKATGDGLRAEPGPVAGVQVVELATEPDYRAALAVVEIEPPSVKVFSF